MREVLDALEAARRVNGATDHRHHLAHLQVVDPADRPRFRALGATATIQPYWACHDPQMDVLTWPFLPPERAALQYAFHSLRAAGARLAGGSDWTVSTPDVLAEVEVAVTRVSPEHRDQPPFLPAESLTLIEALAAFTSGSAYVNHLDDRRARSRWASWPTWWSLTATSSAPRRVRPSDARVLLTLSEGQVVHRGSRPRVTLRSRLGSCLTVRQDASGQRHEQAGRPQLRSDDQEQQPREAEQRHRHEPGEEAHGTCHPQVADGHGAAHRRRRDGHHPVTTGPGG